jgi:HTH-type transcriptional regulator / antitoxin HigA
MNASARKLQTRYAALAELVPLHPIRNAREYDAAVRSMNELLDAGAADERHGLAGLAGTLGQLIAQYEARVEDRPSISGAAALRFLMQQHDLRQSDLPELGSQGVVSELLSGRRDFNSRQVRALAQRFGVSPAVFL